ncbi:MAG: ketoacyl-ACP synthase III [Verrucomicrobia bacterium]|nr:ketoacyl-ACP synthase III [Verrucomicrobiota bacterium]
MKFTFQHKRIAGILTVLPQRELSFIEEMKNYNFPEARSLKLMETMGYNKRRVVEPGTCLSDLAVFGLKSLFDRGFLQPEEIDALLVVTHSPDYIMPPTSNIIQGRLCLKHDTLCLDISQGCAGFVVGLTQAFMLLEQESIRKVVLINGDILSQRTSPKDRSIYPLIGDAVTITLLERDSRDGVIHTNIKMDGSRGDALMIPAGGIRLPCSPETALLENVGDNNLRAKNHLRMEGSAIFNFVQTEVPPLVQELLAGAGVSIESVDHFVCHQSNRFMLEKLADKMNIPRAKMPDNVVENFGNSSGATIPVAITLNLPEALKQGRALTCLVGYGGGLTWAGMLMDMGNLAFCEMVTFF